MEKDGEVFNVDPTGQLIVGTGASELMVTSAIGGVGIMGLFEDWIAPHLSSGALEPVLEDWWPKFSGPYLYYPGRRLVPAPLRAFIDFTKARDILAATASVREDVKVAVGRRLDAAA